ncbi:hypothetical protein [Halobellus ruber]|uniref:DUF7967 domain-containing protein n=1 Tax=Halobellus ruber TaxID=2761102 RepID=A0A7J9SLM8_9EURY|nr:hypothetical protein [Halobellus ruber]MBB6647432.1 hypothetical protein [Halobellus ruber]
MTDADAVRCWLVERTYTDRGLVDMTYATPDGSRAHRRQVSTAVMRQRGAETTAAVEVEAAELESVDDADTRERYAAEAERMRNRHDPGEEV